MKQIESYVRHLLPGKENEDAAQELIALLMDSAAACMQERGCSAQEAQRIAIQRFEADADVQRLYVHRPRIGKPWRCLLLVAALCCLALTAVCPFAQSRALDERWLQVWNEQYAIEQQLAQYLYAQREDPTSMTLSAADQQTIQTILAPRFAADDVRYAAFYAFSYAQGEQVVQQSRSVVDWLDTCISEEVDRWAHQSMQDAAYEQAVYVAGDTSIGRRPDPIEGIEPNRYGERLNLWFFTHPYGPIGSPSVYWYVEYMFGPDGRYCQPIATADGYTESYSPMQTALYTQVNAPYAALGVVAYLAYDLLFAIWALLQMRRHGDAPLFWQILVCLLGIPAYAIYWLVRHKKWEAVVDR